MNKNKKLLIVGGTSALGSRIATDSLRLPGWKVYTTSSKPSSGGHLTLDLEYEQDFHSLNFVDQNTTVLIFSAVSDPTTVFGDIERAKRINVDGTSRLIEFLSRRDCRILFASSVEVFDGENPPQTEDRAPNPLNAYGAMKAEIEGLMLAMGHSSRFSIVRTPWISHLDIESRCVIKNTYQGMLGVEMPHLASDYITGIISADDLSLAYLRLLTSKELPRIIHFASDGFFSRSQLGSLIKKTSIFQSGMRFSETLFRDLSLIEPRAQDTRLSNGLAKSIYDLDFEPIEETIAKKVKYLDSCFGTR